MKVYRRYSEAHGRTRPITWTALDGSTVHGWITGVDMVAITSASLTRSRRHGYVIGDAVFSSGLGANRHFRLVEWSGQTVLLGWDGDHMCPMDATIQLAPPSAYICRVEQYDRDPRWTRVC